MKTILIAGFQHETNTFGATKAQFKDFEEADCWPPLLRGHDVLSGTAGINLPIAGFINEASGFENFELDPVVWASAEPSSYVTEDAFDRISGVRVNFINVGRNYHYLQAAQELRWFTNMIKVADRQHFGIINQTMTSNTCYQPSNSTAAV